MTTQINPMAGKLAPLSSLIDVAKLVTAYFEVRPDPVIAAQRVVFGTSGHRGSAFDGSFNEWHVLARGYKYDPPNGGPATQGITNEIEADANRYPQAKLQGVKRVLLADAIKASTTHRHDYLNAYVADLDNVIDMGAISDSQIRMGVDPLGGAGVHYWARAADGWFAARPSGTEDIYKIYAESFRGVPQLQQILKEAQATVDAVIAHP